MTEKLVPCPQGYKGELCAYIPAGSFQRGDNAIGDASERPVRDIYVSAFYMDPHETTWREWEKFRKEVGRTDLPIPAESVARLPIWKATYREASDYCEWKGGRLPTEAEWEKAARGPKGCNYGIASCNNSLKLREEANFTWDHDMQAVGSHAPNDYGLYDMSGNVSEWVQDWYQRDYYFLAPEKDPQGPTLGTFRVVRGGGFGYGPFYLRAASRYFAPPDKRDFFGFRCVRPENFTGPEERQRL